MSRRLRSVEPYVRALRLTCAALLFGVLPPLWTHSAKAGQSEVRTEHCIVLQIEGANGEQFAAVTRELLSRIDVEVRHSGEPIPAPAPALLHVSVHLDGTRGGFVARREANGSVIARSDTQYESEELLREALAHTLLSLVDAVKQGLPVPKDLQGPDEPSAETPVAAPEAAPPAAVQPIAPSPKRKPVAATQKRSRPAVRPWQITGAGTCALLNGTQPLLGGRLRVERRIDAHFGAGVALGLATTPNFHAQGFTLDQSRQSLQGFGTWQVLERGHSRLLLAPFLGLDREVAEALSGEGELAAPQSKWLSTLGVHARARHSVGSFVFEAELGARVFPIAPRLFVTQDNNEITLFEPWSVQPELGLALGLSF
jgi:hypothetical protein